MTCASACRGRATGNAGETKLLVTGALGKIGRSTVTRAQRAGHDVVRTDLATPAYGPVDPAAAPYLRADLTDAGQAIDLVGRVRPDAVVHTAGIPEPFQDTEVAVFDTNLSALSTSPRPSGSSASRAWSRCPARPPRVT